MSDEIKRAKARTLYNDELLKEIMDKLEADAVDRAVYENLDSPHIKDAALAEVRAIRNLRSKLKSLSAEPNEAAK